MTRGVLWAAALVVAAVCAACGGEPVGPGPGPVSPPPGPPGPPGPPVPPPPGSPLLVGAGDIADCAQPGARLTAALLDSIGGTVFTTGDNAYPNGAAADFRNCYEPTWGRHKARTRPSPGNHDYEQPGAGPYFSYFGANAGPAGVGYYSFPLGDWLAVSLNSNIAAGAGSAQAAWLRQILAGSSAPCTIAYWHHPRFGSGQHGSNGNVAELWNLLYEAGAEIVLAGHEHFYERFAPQTPGGTRDPDRGLRQFIVGTGGATPYEFVGAHPNSEARISQWGVLKLTLGPQSYAWEFIGASGASDTGVGSCH